MGDQRKEKLCFCHAGCISSFASILQRICTRMVTSWKRLWKSCVAGVEFQNECFCGDTVRNASVTHDSYCRQYLCSDSSALYCGGHEAIAVYSTGIDGRWPTYYRLIIMDRVEATLLFLYWKIFKNEWRTDQKYWSRYMYTRVWFPCRRRSIFLLFFIIRGI